jgi:hypothetical protein
MKRYPVFIIHLCNTVKHTAHLDSVIITFCAYKYIFFFHRIQAYASVEYIYIYLDHQLTVLNFKSVSALVPLVTSIAISPVSTPIISVTSQRLAALRLVAVHQ